jgi:Ca2+-binding EF-hand superfamily protein
MFFTWLLCALFTKPYLWLTQKYLQALVRNATDATRESRVLDIVNAMEPLAYRKMDFEEFCAAAISTHQLEALDGWEQIASTAFEHFEQEGNRVISVEELARELNLGPTAYSILKDWIRNSDGKLSLLGYTKFLHGVTLRSSNTRHH